MTSSTFLSTNHVRAYHVTLSCGLHGADDVVHAGEQKVKLFVLISEINLEPQPGTSGLLIPSGLIFSNQFERVERFPLVLNSHSEFIIPCNLDVAI